MLGMALGAIFYGKKLKESCCSGGSCIKKEKEVCPGEHNKNARLVRMATIGDPSKEQG